MTTRNRQTLHESEHPESSQLPMCPRDPEFELKANMLLLLFSCSPSQRPGSGWAANTAARHPTGPGGFVPWHDRPDKLQMRITFTLPRWAFIDEPGLRRTLFFRHRWALRREWCQIVQILCSPCNSVPPERKSIVLAMHLSPRDHERRVRGTSNNSSFLTSDTGTDTCCSVLAGCDTSIRESYIIFTLMEDLTTRLFSQRCCLLTQYVARISHYLAPPSTAVTKSRTFS